MNYYIIDYENVQAYAFEGLDQLTKKDRICIVYSRKSNKISMSILEMIKKQKVKVELCEAYVGTPNALDFQLASYLGYLVLKNRFKRNITYTIISFDSGYDKLIEFWENRNVSVRRATNLAGELIELSPAKAARRRKKKKKANHLSQEEVEAEIRRLVPEPEDAEVVIEIVRKMPTKMQINNCLVKRLKSPDNKKASEIYQAIRPLLSNKK